MHFIGMSMRLSAVPHYSAAALVVSVFLAIIISLVALVLTFRFRSATISWSWRKGVGALVMGSAITVIPYTGADLSHALSITSVGTAGIIVVTFMVLGLTLLTAVVERRISTQALDLAASEQRFRAVFKGAAIGIAIIELDGSKLVAVNPAYRKMLGCTAEEMQTVGIFDELTHPADRESDKQIFLGILAAGKDVDYMDKHYVLLRRRSVATTLDQIYYYLISYIYYNFT